MEIIREYKYEDATNLLKYIPENPKKIVDLGAGKRDSPISEQIKQIKCDHLVSVEAFEPYLNYLLKGGHSARLHDVVHAHIVHSNYKVPECDVVIMIDVIEHLEKQDALDLIAYLKTKTKNIIIFTPEGDTVGYSNNDMGNELQLHKSAWDGQEFEDLGFSVTIYDNFHTHVKEYPIGVIWAVWQSEDCGQ